MQTLHLKHRLLEFKLSTRQRLAFVVPLERSNLNRIHLKGFKLKSQRIEVLDTEDSQIRFSIPKNSLRIEYEYSIPIKNRESIPRTLLAADG